MNDLKPMLYGCKMAMVCDPGYEICGASESIAYELMANHICSNVYAYGLKDAVKSFKPGAMNMTPNSDQIVMKIMNLMKC